MVILYELNFCFTPIRQVKTSNFVTSEHCNHERVKSFDFSTSSFLLVIFYAAAPAVVQPQRRMSIPAWHTDISIKGEAQSFCIAPKKR